MGSRFSPPPSFTGSGQSQGTQPPGMQNYGPPSMNTNMMDAMRSGGPPQQSMWNSPIMNALRMQHQLNATPTGNPNPQPAYTPPAAPMPTQLPPPAPAQVSKPAGPTPWKGGLVELGYGAGDLG